MADSASTGTVGGWRARVLPGVLAGSLGLNLLVAVVLFTPLTEALYPLLDHDEPPRAAQVIVILPGEQYQNGLPGFNSLSRLRKGLELYRQGLADFIICAGGLPRAGVPLSICRAMREELIARGVPPGSVLALDKTQNTYNDLRYLVDHYSRRFDFNQALFVTSPYHAYRVRGVLNRLGVTGGRVVAASFYQRHPYVWAERPLLFREVMREFLAIVYFRLRGYM